MQQRNSKTILLSKTIGQILKKYRIEVADKSINSVAHEYGLDVGNISRIENGVTEVKLVTLWKLADAYEIPLSVLIQKIEAALGGNAKQTVKIQQGIPSDKAKEITKAIKDAKLKVSASIQGDQLRVSSKSKDELQNTMALLRGGDFGVELQFTNYR